MDQVKKILFAVLEALLRFVLARKNVVIHYCFIALYVLLSILISFAVLVLAGIQFVCLLITTRPVNAVQTLSHRLTVYLYKILRFITLNEAQKPFPFGPLPQEVEPAEDVDLTAELPEKKFFGGEKAEGTESPAEAPKDKTADAAEGAPSGSVASEEKKEEAPAEDASKEPIEMGYKEEKKEE